MERCDSRNFKIVAIQMSTLAGDCAYNRAKLSDIIKENSDYLEKSDLLILPEVWTVGWACEDFVKSAETFENSKTLQLLSEVAKKYNINILGGSFIIEGKDKKYYNTCPVINKEGKLLTTYSKMHLYSYCGCEEGKYITPGENPVLVEINGIKIGLTICYDIRFPEIFRAYREAGADLLVNMAAWGLSKPIPWETLTRARAIENQAYMVALTQAGKIKGDEWNIGHSRIFDYLGNTVTEIKDQREGVMYCEINFDSMYEYRHACTILNDIHKEYKVRII